MKHVLLNYSSSRLKPDGSSLHAVDLWSAGCQLGVCLPSSNVVLYTSMTEDRDFLITQFIVDYTLYYIYLESKNQYARDDPAFLVLLSLCLLGELFAVCLYH